MKRILGVLLLCGLCGFGTSVDALELSPFRVRNLSPTALIHGLPVAETPHLLKAGGMSLSGGFEVANNATFDSAGNEQIILDGETYIATLGMRYGVTDRLQIGLDLPWTWQADGFLDNFISDWHDAFGLPNGDRDDLPDDQLSYQYKRNNITDLSLVDETDGLGDLRLHLAWQLKRSARSALTLQSQLKAPTGDAGKLTGSEAWDIALALSAQHAYPVGNGQLGFWGGVGGAWLGDGKVIEDKAEEFAASAWLGAGWIPLDWLALKLQIDSHTPLYDSDLAELGDPAVILTMGGTLGLGDQTSLDLGIGEDLNVNASPDVTFHILLDHRF